MTQIVVRTSLNRLLFLPLACAGILSLAKAQSPLQDSLRQRQGIEHRLTKLVVAGEEKALPTQPRITLKIVADGLLGGNSGVNLYFGGFQVDEAGRVQWSKPGFATTLIAGPEDLMNLEQQFLAALQTTQRIHVMGRGLTFETEDGETQLVFEEVSQEQTLENFLGKKLVLARMLVDGNDTALPGDPRLTLLLTVDGRAYGNSGVNSYRGSYMLVPPDGIELPRTFATTRMAGPPELMDLENSYLKALSAVTKIHASAGGVTLENEGKTMALEFHPLE